MKFFHRQRTSKPAPIDGAVEPTGRQSLREFAYLDEVSVQSLLVSLIGELPSEVTSLSARSSEAEVSATAGASSPLIAKAELSARFKGGTSSSSQVLSRAVAESLFKRLYELSAPSLIWREGTDQDMPIDLERGSLLEIEVELAPDPVYGFSAMMGVFGDLAEDFPALLENPQTAAIHQQMQPVNKALERLMVGLIPLRSESVSLRAGEIDGEVVAGTAKYFESAAVQSETLFVVGVTEQEKYWRDVRRVLFTKSRFTIFGRISRRGVQRSWVPVKLTEVMRPVMPAFPNMITRAGRTGYTAPVNVRERATQEALRSALVSYAMNAGGVSATARAAEVEAAALRLSRDVDGLSGQREAFKQIGAWLIDQGVVGSLPENDRDLQIDARNAGGLTGIQKPASFADFVVDDTATDLPPESLVDVEIIAIYW